LLRACTADALDKCLSVLKPSGHYSHIQNLGTDPDVMQRLKQQHEAGQGPGVSHIFVTPNAGQLGEVLQMMAADAGQLGEVLQMMAADAGQLGEVLQMMAAGKVKLEVAKVRVAEVA
jgi:hypothetical protein